MSIIQMKNRRTKNNVHLVPALPVEGEGRTGEAGALDPADQAGPLAHPVVLDGAPGDGHPHPVCNVTSTVRYRLELG